MEFKQSRFQFIFAKMYEQVCAFIWEVVFVLIASVFAFEQDLLVVLIIFLVFAVGYFLWMLYGPHEEGDQSLYLDENVFRYTRRLAVTEFSWNDYQGYQITKTIPYRIKVKDKIYGTTTFSFYAFSAEQRRKIFAFLDSKSNELKDNKD